MKIEEPSPAVTKSEPPKAIPESFSSGQKLGGVYVLRKRITDGDERMWLAHDEVLGKEVSLYFLPDDVRGDARAMGELRQEVKRNRQLIHPNILRIYDLVEERDWTAISMDAHEAQSLASMLRAKQGHFFEPAEVKQWVYQLCQTLGDVHKIQVVHRNVSPANLLVDKTGKLLLANFGIARVIEDAKGRLRKSADPEQNLAYLSPQQLDGEPASPADDIYSAGATIYALLTGVAPFSGTNLMSKIRKSAPTLMMECRSQLDKKGGTILPVWETAVAQCLAKQAADRPRSMYELASKLGLTAKAMSEAVVPVTAAGVTAVAAAVNTGELSSERKMPAPKGRADVVTQGKAPESKERSVEKAAPRAGRAGPATESLAVAASAKAAPKTPAGREAAPQKEASKPTVESNGVSDIYPSLYPRRPGSRFAPLATLLTVAALGAGIYYFMAPDNSERSQAPDSSAVGSEAVATRRTSEEFTPSEGEETVPSQSGSVGISTPNATVSAANPSSIEPRAGSQGGANAMMTDGDAGSVGTDRNGNGPVEGAPNQAMASGAEPQRNDAPTPAVDTLSSVSAPNPSDVLSTVTKAASTDFEPLPPSASLVSKNPAVARQPQVAEKLDAATKARRAAEAADKAAREAQTKFQQAQTAAMEAKRALDEKAKAAAPALQSVDTLAKERQRHEEEMKNAEVAAEQAKQLAEERAKQAAEAKKALAEFEAQNKDKLAAVDKVSAEIEALKKTADEKLSAAEEIAKATVAAVEKRQQEVATLKRTQEDAAQAVAAAEKAADGEARRMAEQREQQRQQIEKEIEQMKRAFEEKMRTLEALKDQTSASSPGAMQPVAAGTAPAEPVSIPSDVAASTGAVVTLASVPASQSSPLATLETENVAKPAPKAPQGAEENSLGMRFAPVGNLMMSVWLTRVKDFAVFAEETKLKATGWRSPGFRQGAEHPVVNVTWNDAVEFCKWLTEREKKKGTLPAGQIYRLPTDLEWSKAVGLPEEDGKTPEARDMGVLDVFPWGTQWPPPLNAGNYTGEETGSDVAIQGYDDGYAWTSPVGAFAPNQFGLYDMGGNVWQWCLDSWNGQSKAKVLRGASWYNGAVKLSLLSSCRVQANPDRATDNYGFRVVRAPEGGRTNKR